MMHILMVFVGGGMGSLLRYAVNGGVLRYFPTASWPIATLIVNTVGCLLIGYLAGVSVYHGEMAYERKLLIITGFLGGFTTFSAFGLETFYLMREGHGGMVLLNVFLNVALGLMAVVIGYAFGCKT